MKKLFLFLILFFSMLMVVGCSKTTEIDISKYIKIHCSGTDRLGSLYTNIDSDFFLDSDIFSVAIPEYLQNSYDVTIIPSKSDNIQNGDKITLKLVYNEKLYEEELKVKLSLSENTYIVSGLDKKYLVVSDLTNDEYLKLKEETEKRAKEYMQSITPLSLNYKSIKFEDFEFINAYIENQFEFTSKYVENEPSILYAYKVNLIYDNIGFTGTTHETQLCYVFVPVENLVFDENGNLSKYEIQNYNFPYKQTYVNNDVSIESALSSISSKDTFQLIDIK